MTALGLDGWQWLAVFQRELLLFAGVFFLLGALDDLAVDLCWFWLKCRGRVRDAIVDRERLRGNRLTGPTAVMIPAWDEALVLPITIAHILRAWPQENLHLYIGVYNNDPATKAAAQKGAAGDPRVRIVTIDVPGPSTKADCLNRLFTVLCEDEARRGEQFAALVFHDAEDLVDPAGLGLLDRAIADGADFAQLPVEPLPQSGRNWLGSHYCEEFAEAHGKAMVVRGALGAALPAAGVGCAVARPMFDLLCERRGADVPFEPHSLTEDYELGLAVGQLGGTCRFIRARGKDGALVATRAYFPGRLENIVRQKTRWVHGIALQGWDRTGWTGGILEAWMRLRDRRGPLSALVLLAGYALLFLTLMGWGASAFGAAEPAPLSSVVLVLLFANLAFFVWRAAMRFAFTTREYGWREGLRAILRIPIANIIAIMSGWRAVKEYARDLGGQVAQWDKTDHDSHPAGSTAMSQGWFDDIRSEPVRASGP